MWLLAVFLERRGDDVEIIPLYTIVPACTGLPACAQGLPEATMQHGCMPHPCTHAFADWKANRQPDPGKSINQSINQ